MSKYHIKVNSLNICNITHTGHGSITIGIISFNFFLRIQNSNSIINNKAILRAQIKKLHTHTQKPNKNEILDSLLVCYGL